MKPILPVLPLIILPLLIMVPFFAPGYLFLLDMVWLPQSPSISEILAQNSNLIPLKLLIWLFNQVLPMDVIQKLILTLILLLGSLGMYRLCRLELSPWLSTLGGLIFLLNPFVYERFLAGQYLVLAGCMFLPILLSELTILIKNYSPKRVITFSVLLAIFPLINSHFAYIGGGLCAAILFGGFIMSRSSKTGIDDKKLTIILLTSLVSLLIINSFWLFHDSATIEKVSEFTNDDLLAFATESDESMGVIINVLALYGFWQNDFTMPKDTLIIWWMLPLFFLPLLALGGYSQIKDKKPLGTALFVAFIPTLLVAIGYRTELTKPLIDFLLHIPGFIGLRETHKVAGVIALAYAFLVPLGIYACAEQIAKKEKKLAPLVTILLGIFIAILTIGSVKPIFWQFDNQLKVSDYPPGWYEVNEILQPTETALFLPYDGYLRFDFTGYNLISNPASRFFKAEVIQGDSFDNFSIGESTDQDLNSVIYNLLNFDEIDQSDINYLQKTGVEYIILGKNHEANRYDFLENNPQVFTKQFGDDSIELYRLMSN